MMFSEAFIDGANMGNRASVVRSCRAQIYFYIHCLTTRHSIAIFLYNLFLYIHWILFRKYIYFFILRRPSVALFLLLENVFLNFFFNLFFIHCITKTLTHILCISKYMCRHICKSTSKLFPDLFQIFTTISLWHSLG